MRLFGSLVFLIGAVCLGAYAYFPVDTSQYGRLSEIIHAQDGEFAHDRGATLVDVSAATYRRTFSPGAHLLRSSGEAAVSTATGRRLEGKSEKPSAVLSNPPAPSSASANAGDLAANNDRSPAWRTVVVGENGDQHRAAPKRDDYLARYELARRLQTELARVGCYGGNIDGDWGPGSKHAAGEFLRKVNATLPVGSPDYILLTLIQGHADRACGVDCPSGQGLASDGRCVSNVIVARGGNRGRQLARKLPDVRNANSANKKTVEVAVAAVPPAPTRLLRSANPLPLRVEAPTARPAAFPGLMAVGASTSTPEVSSLPAAPVTAALAPPTPSIMPEQADPRRRGANFDQAFIGGSTEAGATNLRDRASPPSATERLGHDGDAQKTRKGKEQQRARYKKRDMVRTYAGRVQRGSPQHNLMLSLGGVF